MSLQKYQSSFGHCSIDPSAPARNLGTYVNYLRQQNVVNDVIYNVCGDKIGKKYLIRSALLSFEEKNGCKTMITLMLTQISIFGAVRIL